MLGKCAAIPLKCKKNRLHVASSEERSEWRYTGTHWDNSAGTWRDAGNPAELENTIRRPESSRAKYELFVYGVCDGSVPAVTQSVSVMTYCDYTLWCVRRQSDSSGQCLVDVSGRNQTTVSTLRRRGI